MEKISNFISQSPPPPTVMILHENSFVYVKNVVSDDLTPALCHFISMSITLFRSLQNVNSTVQLPPFYMLMVPLQHQVHLQ